MGLKAVVIFGASIQPINTGSVTVTGSASPNITIYPLINTASRTFNLPASPASNQIIVPQDAGNNFSAYPLTVQGNGNVINLPNVGTVTSITISGNGEDLWFDWNGQAWGVLA